MSGWRQNWVFYVLILVLFVISVTFAINKINSKADIIYVDTQDSRVIKTLIDSIMPPLNSINKNLKNIKQ